jgi:hypothetical protein
LLRLQRAAQTKKGPAANAGPPAIPLHRKSDVQLVEASGGKWRQEEAAVNKKKRYGSFSWHACFGPRQSRRYICNFQAECVSSWIVMENLRDLPSFSPGARLQAWQNPKDSGQNRRFGGRETNR